MWFKWPFVPCNCAMHPKLDFPWHYGIKNMFVALYRVKWKDVGVGKFAE